MWALVWPMQCLRRRCLLPACRCRPAWPGLTFWDFNGRDKEGPWLGAGQAVPKAAKQHQAMPLIKLQVGRDADAGWVQLGAVAEGHQQALLGDARGQHRPTEADGQAVVVVGSAVVATAPHLLRAGGGEHARGRRLAVAARHIDSPGAVGRTHLRRV